MQTLNKIAYLWHFAHFACLTFPKPMLGLFKITLQLHSLTEPIFSPKLYFSSSASILDLFFVTPYVLISASWFLLSDHLPISISSTHDRPQSTLIHIAQSRTFPRLVLTFLSAENTLICLMLHILLAPQLNTFNHLFLNLNTEIPWISTLIHKEMDIGLHLRLCSSLL